MSFLLTQAFKGCSIGLITGLLAAFGGPYIETKQEDKSLQGLMFLWKQSVWQTLALTIVVGPLLEETLFRLVGISILQHLFSTILAIIITSVLFGLAHNQFPLNIISGALGIILGVVFVYWGLAASFFAHAVHNTVVIIHLVWRFRKITGTSLTVSLKQISIEEAIKQYTQ